MPRSAPPKRDLRTVDPTAPPAVDGVVGVGGGTTHYCRRCGHTLGHVDSGHLLVGLVTYLAPHMCVTPNIAEPRQETPQ
ncbi:hypothetical protein [Nocardiopsis rhodophaea]|uniref:hypothetical protein n=1 Tax=Nocardiopsis rhodophaea TaxID=280238 RepID=UPI0031DD2B47